MAKPKPVTIPSDDCIVTVAGEQYAVHEGETVTLIRGFNVEGIAAIKRLVEIAPALDAARGEPNEGMRVVETTDSAMQAVCRALAPRIVSWTWTDMAGRPLPQPDGTPERLMALETQELSWLIAACTGETPGERKNG